MTSSEKLGTRYFRVGLNETILMRAFHRRALALLALLSPVAAHAQAVRGITVDASNAPVPGVVVTLQDSASRIAARGMTNGQGEFRLVATKPGTYRLRTLRIGFKPTVSEPRVLNAGAEVSIRVVLAGVPVALDAVRTTGESVCRAFADSAAATFAVWEQVHGALTAADLAANGRTIVATTLTYERQFENLEARGVRRVLTQSTHVATGYVARPWHEVPVDSLHRAGYIVPEHDDITAYYAPGLDVLLSSRFIEDHCFHLTTDRGFPALVGIAFEPSPERKRIPEIRGTLWVDRASAELRRLEFKYANASQEDEEYGGGGVDFQRASDGTWFISRWSIRMPVFDQSKIDRAQFRRSPRVIATQVTGGELAVARRGSDTLWTRAPFAVAGTIRDSVSGAPITASRIALVGTPLEATSDASGKFSLRGVLPGEYAAEVQTRSLDSVNMTYRATVMILDSATAVDLRAPTGTQFLAALCGGKAPRSSDLGVIIGNARADGTSSATGLKVAAEWSVDPKDPTRIQHAEGRAASDGSYRFCDAPLDRTIALSAKGDSSSTAASKLIRLSSAVRLARADLELYSMSELAKRGATFIGTVVSDSSHLPVVGAEVSLPELGKSAITDSGGEFRIAGVASGEQRVVVRRIGYGAADTKLAFSGFEPVERRIVLGRAITLEAVTVTAQYSDRAMPGFEDNKRVGLGKFMTRAEIAKFDGMTMTSALSQFASLGLIGGMKGNIWATSRLSPVAACLPGSPGTHDALTVTGVCLVSHGYYIPEKGESAPIACYSLVYIDGQLMNGSREPTEPFDLRSVSPERIEAMEYYAGPAETPMKYSRMGSSCGVLVIWTRKGS